eukprot:gene37759-49461_t
MQPLLSDQRRLVCLYILMGVVLTFTHNRVNIGRHEYSMPITFKRLGDNYQGSRLGPIGMEIGLGLIFFVQPDLVRLGLNIPVHIESRASSANLPALTLKTISVQDFGKILQGDSRSLYQIVDVREPDELLSLSLQGNDVINLPLSKFEEWEGNILDILDRDKPTLCLCKSGKRSSRFATFLVQQAGFKDVYVVEGGLLKYANEVDPSVAHF